MQDDILYPCADGRKATKEELVLMYHFLREKYQLIPRGPVTESHYSPTGHSGSPAREMFHTVKEEPSENLVARPLAEESPFLQLLERCKDKANRLLNDAGDDEVTSRVQAVFHSVLIPLYQNSKSMNAGCEFLDAGHQLETLLDVGLVYGKVHDTLHVIKQGCCELIGE
jgi:hypothetical protein